MQKFKFENIPNYSIRELTVLDAPMVQNLLEHCSDFQMLVEGKPVPPEAGMEVFSDVPPNRKAEEKIILGLFDHSDQLAGLADLLPDYPDKRTWWIGLLLLVPEIRGKGIGRKFTASIIEHARSNQANAILLGVVEENAKGYQFWQRNGFTLSRITEPRQFGNKMQRVSVMRNEISLIH